MKRRLEAFEGFDGCQRGAGEDVVKFLARWEAAWSKCKLSGMFMFFFIWQRQKSKIKTMTMKGDKHKRGGLVKMQPVRYIYAFLHLA